MKIRYITIILLVILSNATLSSQNIRTINLDLNKTEDLNYKRHFNCIGAGRANEGLRADWQEQLKVIQEEINFKYIRFHGIFHDDMGVYKEDKDGNPIYNWQYVDQLYDFLLSVNIKPFVEFSFMSKDLASGDKTVFWWKGNISKPKSMKKFGDLILAFTQHVTERYGKEEVSQWYFEVWNEPNLRLFFDGTMQDYFDMYETAALAIKSVSKNYRVGGPATAGCGWIKEFVDYTDSKKIPVDFVASHAYNVEKYLDEFGTNTQILKPDSLAVAKEINEAVAKIKHKKNLEFHITEWSSSYSPKDPVHDTYQNATFVLNTLKHIDPNVTSMSYWVFTDIFEEPGIPYKPFHGGFGLINLQGIKKPTFFAYKYLSQLGDIGLSNKDNYSWATKDSTGVQVLLYDFHYPKQGNVSDQEYFVKELKPKGTNKVKINVKNLKDGTYQLLAYKTGYLNNDAFTTYYKMGLPNHLSKSQETVLKDATANSPFMQSVIEIKNSEFSIHLDLLDNDAVLLKLNAL